MIPAWDEDDYVNYHYSRRAVAAVKRAHGCSDLSHITCLERKACRIAETMKYRPPTVVLEDQLLPVVIHDIDGLQV